MLEYENELRLSKKWQERFRISHSSTTHDWMDEAHLLQIEVIKKFMGSSISQEELEFGLFTLRTATQTYPEFKDIPLYVKYNRAFRGKLRVGDQAPDLTLYDLDLQKLSFSTSYLAPSYEKPLFITFSSFT